MSDLFLTGYCRIRTCRATVDGKAVYASEGTDFDPFINGLYASVGTSYPKFYKMDNQCKLGLMAAELLLKDGTFLGRYAGEEVGVVLSNAVSSEDADAQYFRTIADPAEYFPSPALFVYTLASTVTGEICIRHQFKGENAFFVSDNFDAGLLYPYVRHLLHTTNTRACLTGWVNYRKGDFDAFLFTVEQAPNKYPEPLTAHLLHQLYYQESWTH
jgi:hypothetical protein